jgi:hypothetical protein
LGSFLFTDIFILHMNHSVKKIIKEELLLSEGRLKLSPQDIDFINKLIPYYIKSIKSHNKYYRDEDDANYIEKLTSYNHKTIDGKDATVEFWLGTLKGANGWFNRGDSNDLTDQRIGVNVNSFRPAFRPITSDVYEKLTGRDGTEGLRQVLIHELIHAKDPSANHHELNEPMGDNRIESYYSSWVEFSTMTGQFMESILNRTNGICKNISNSYKLNTNEINKIKDALQDILDFYSGKSTEFGDSTREFIDGTSNNAFQRFMTKIIDFGSSLIGGPESSLDTYSRYLSLIKKYNPDGFKEFHKDLYLTIQEAVDMVNTSVETVGKKFYQREYVYDSLNPEQPKPIDKKKYKQFMSRLPYISVGGNGSIKNIKQ